MDSVHTDRDINSRAKRVSTSLNTSRREKEVILRQDGRNQSQNSSRSRGKHRHHKLKSSNHSHRIMCDRRDNFPNGYLEDWSSGASDIPSEDRVGVFENKKSIEKKKSTQNKVKLDSPYTSYKDDRGGVLSGSTLSLDLSERDLTDLIKSSDMSEGRHLSYQYQTQTPTIKYSPVSIILSTQSNILLAKESTHNIRFSTGIVEGSGLSINDNGDEITFQDEGSYRFEMCGDATPFSDVTAKLVFYSPSFSEEVTPFSEIAVPKDESKLLLHGLATILPIKKGQKIYPRLVPSPDESIVLMSNTRLLIHRVA